MCIRDSPAARRPRRLRLASLQRCHEEAALAGDGRGRAHVGMGGIIQSQRRETDEFRITLVADQRLKRRVHGHGHDTLRDERD